MLDVNGDANVTGNAKVPVMPSDGWGNQIGFLDNSGHQRHIIYDDFGPAGGGSGPTKGNLIIHPG
ncbi:MAG: hypothetical protein JSS76_18625 [Bacteroidetes bacterium]|nr:hypothetical protein [Bacteroidota bacterium]